MQQCPILIVGAGPTGLTAATELRRLGVPVRIVDKASTPSTTSRALAIQARTLELLSQRGLTDEMLRIGSRGKFVTIHSERKQLGRVELSAIPSRFNFVLLLAQNETERLLREHLKEHRVEVEASTQLIGFSLADPATSETQEYIAAVLRGPDGRLEELAAAYIICAEGSHSSIRRTLNLDFKGRSLEQSYALADLHIDGEVPEDSLSIFVVERGFLGLFPMGGRRFRMIATDPQGHATNPSDPTLAEMQSLYDADCHIPAALRDVVWTSRFRINSRMLHTFRSGRVFFGGDSAHVHSPAGGQGMNTGIQDMINLCWKLALVYNGHAKSDLLDTYTEERHPVIERLLNTTEKATDAMNSQGAIAHQLMTHIAPLVLDFERARELGARTLSQVKIEYRSSPLSETYHAHGELRAGDRVPDLEVGIDAGDAAPISLHSILDPSRFTVLRIGDASKPRPAADHPWVKTVCVQPPAGADADHFKQTFGASGGLIAVRPDAYIGFIGRLDTDAELHDWLNRHFFPVAGLGSAGGTQQGGDRDTANST